MLSQRIKEVRTVLRLSQTAFGEKVGVSIHVIKNIELDRATPNDLLITHICTVYGINEHWLKTGEGEMFAGKSAEDIAMENAIQAASSSSAIRALLIAYSRLNDQNRAVFEQFVEDYVSEFQAQAAAESVARDNSIFDEPAAHKHASMKEKMELDNDYAAIPLPDDPELLSMRYPVDNRLDSKLIR